MLREFSLLLFPYTSSVRLVRRPTLQRKAIDKNYYYYLYKSFEHFSFLSLQYFVSTADKDRAQCSLWRRKYESKLQCEILTAKHGTHAPPKSLSHFEIFVGVLSFLYAAQHRPPNFVIVVLRLGFARHYCQMAWVFCSSENSFGGSQADERSLAIPLGNCGFSISHRLLSKQNSVADKSQPNLSKLIYYSCTLLMSAGVFEQRNFVFMDEILKSRFDNFILMYFRLSLN